MRPRTQRTSVLVTALAIVASSLVVAQPTAAAGCADYAFVGVRGSGEPAEGASGDDGRHGLGKPVDALYERVKASAEKAGKTVDLVSVPYPAVDVQPKGALTLLDFLEAFTHVGPDYSTSVRSGADNLRTLASARCSTTKLILAGYSQGAEVIGEAIRTSAVDPARVTAAVLFGDPLFNADDERSDNGSFELNYFGSRGTRPVWNTAFPVFSYCNDYDHVCNLRGGIGLPGGGKAYVTDLIRLGAHLGAEGHFGLDAIEHVGDVHSGYVTDGVPDAAAQLAKLIGAKATAAQAPSDTVFVIDSTGSMGDELDAVKKNVNALVASIAAKSPDYRFALVDFKDAGDDYQSRVDVPFTTSTATFTSGVGSISAGGGGDTPESMYSGIMTGLGLPWRDGVKKNVIVISDAPGKDPEPVTGYTLDTVTKKAFAVDPAQIYGVNAGSSDDAANFQKAVAGATGGMVTGASDDFVAALQGVLTKAGSAPIAAITPVTSAVSGMPVRIGAFGTTGDPTDPIVSYDWNLGTGTPAGSYDRTTTTPALTTTYEKEGTYTVAVRARAQSGLVGLATSTITVTAPPATAPPAPVGLAAKAGDGTVTLAWAAGSGSPSDTFLIEAGDGTVLDALRVPAQASYTWTQSGLANGAAVSYRIVALNAAGQSAPSPVVTTTPSAPTSVPPPPAPPSASSPVTTGQLIALPRIATAGRPVLLAGTRFPARSTVTVTFDGFPARWVTRTDQRGRFLAVVLLPRGTSAGIHTVAATAGDVRGELRLQVRRR